MKQLLTGVCLLLLSEFSAANDEECTNCVDENAKLSAEELRVLRLEYIKVQILSKLRLEKPPNVTAQPLSEVLNLELLADSEDEDPEEEFSREDYYGKTRGVVIFSNSSSIASCETRNSTRCFQFRLTSEVASSNIKTAELWVHEKIQHLHNSTPTYTIFAVQLSEMNDSISRRPLSSTTVNSSSQEWLKFDVTSALASWVESGQLKWSLEMKCEDCDYVSKMADDNKAPFLSIRVDVEDLKHSRRRREQICSENSTLCCKEIFNVSFEEIGWHRWIVRPESYNANFCRGSCTSDISSARYFHTTVIRGFLQSQSATGRNFTPSLCCSPFQMKSLTIIYMTEERHIYKKTLPNMIAESCDCV